MNEKEGMPGGTLGPPFTYAFLILCSDVCSNWRRRVESDQLLHPDFLVQNPSTTQDRYPWKTHSWTGKASLELHRYIRTKLKTLLISTLLRISEGKWYAGLTSQDLLKKKLSFSEKQEFTWWLLKCTVLCYKNIYVNISAPCVLKSIDTDL